jgi:hypothetical protein
MALGSSPLSYKADTSLTDAGYIQPAEAPINALAKYISSSPVAALAKAVEAARPRRDATNTGLGPALSEAKPAGICTAIYAAKNREKTIPVAALEALYPA